MFLPVGDLYCDIGLDLIADSGKGERDFIALYEVDRWVAVFFSASALSDVVSGWVCLCMRNVQQMGGVEMVSAEQQQQQQPMHQRRKWAQMSEDEGKERREQQRLWYRRRRAQMTEEEIACQNERRRLRYRLRRLRASAEETVRAVYDLPMLAMEGGESSRANGQRTLEENERGGQQGISGLNAQTTSGLIDLHDAQQKFRYEQPRWQLDGGAQVREHGSRQHQWRWKVEARKGRCDMADDPPSDLSLVVRGPTVVRVDAQSDDSETTETDESLQGMLSPSSFGSLTMISRPADGDLPVFPGEGILYVLATVIAPSVVCSFVGLISFMHSEISYVQGSTIRGSFSTAFS